VPHEVVAQHADGRDHTHTRTCGGFILIVQGFIQRRKQKLPKRSRHNDSTKLTTTEDYRCDLTRQ
jgi:hypothetical protein